MKILVTGASGFIGGHLLDALIDLYGNCTVVAFSSKEIANVSCILYSDVRGFHVEPYDFSDFTHLIHAGAFTPKSNMQANDIERCNDNIFFTERLLGLGFSNLRRIIYLSTLDVYDGQGVLSENFPIKPISLYGASKYYCEELIKRFAKSRNIEYMNLRVGHVYGPGEEKYQKVLPLAISKILSGRKVELWGDGSELRSFIYIKDVVRAIVSAIQYMPADLDVNIVSGRFISIRDLLNKVIQISGEDVRLEIIESYHDRRDLVFDNSKLVRTLLKDETDLDFGLKEEFNHMKRMYENNI